jgi:hypothetical protein
LEKNANQMKKRKERLIEAAIKRYRTLQTELEDYREHHAAPGDEYHRILMRLLHEKDKLRRLGVNIE